MNTTPKRIEISPDGSTWLPLYVREAPVEVRPSGPPDPALLPTGHVWGRMGGQWVPVFDQAAC
jgi:hypothetical protein